MLYAYHVNIGYARIASSGFISCWGWDLLRHWRAGGIVLARLTRGGEDASWTHGLGIHTPLNPGDTWVEIECHGDPCNPSHWLPTGKSWPVGSDVDQIKVDAGSVDCCRGVPRPPAPVEGG